MAYTPINWQTGDTITAEKMNKMDNGWSVDSSSQTLFNETVITELDPDYPEDGASGRLVYSDEITVDSLTITFNGTEYVCPKTETMTGVTYGSSDFVTYPFVVFSGSFGNSLVTATAGTYTIKAETASESVEVSQNFEKAVNSIIPQNTAVQCVSGVTRWSDISVGQSERSLLYFWTSNYGCFLITQPGRPCLILPENTNVTATFDPDTNIFIVRES